MRTAFYMTSLLLAMILSCCGSHKEMNARETAVAAPSVQERDSQNTKVEIVIIEKIETCSITLPAESRQVIVPKDTTSTLETRFAKSTARYENGFIYHDLWDKETPIAVPVVNRTERQDSASAATRTKEVQVPVPYPVKVEVNKLTWAQQAEIYGFRVLLALFCAILMLRYRKKIFALVRRFI